MTPPKIKICCIGSIDEAHLASGASALGMVSAMPGGPGAIEEDAIAEIIVLCRHTSMPSCSIPATRISP